MRATSVHCKRRDNSKGIYPIRHLAVEVILFLHFRKSAKRQQCITLQADYALNFAHHHILDVSLASATRKDAFSNRRGGEHCSNGSCLHARLSNEFDFVYLDVPHELCDVLIDLGTAHFHDIQYKKRFDFMLPPGPGHTLPRCIQPNVAISQIIDTISRPTAVPYRIFFLSSEASFRTCTKSMSG